MRISYIDKSLRKTCENAKEANKKHGLECGQKLRTRLADLEAAEHVGELAAGRPHPLKGDRAGQFALNLSGGKRLVFAPNHDPIPINDDGATDWKRVTAISIVFIGDYHG